MNSFKNLLLAAAFVPAFFSCTEKKEEKVFIRPDLLDTIFSSSFEGVIPCPDCPGIESSVRIYSDSTISRTVYYQDRNELPVTKVGTWKLNDSIFTATFDREKLFFKIKDYNKILRVGSDLKEVTGEFANDYVLHKRKTFKPENIEGIYWVGDTLNLYNKLQIKHLKKENYNLVFSHYNKLDSLSNCKTSFKAVLDKNLQLNSKLNDSLGDLRIVFTRKAAHVLFENVSKDSLRFKCNDTVRFVPYKGSYKKR